MDDNTQPVDGLIGKNLGQFTILEEIGRGGMATVYSATQKSMNRKVAVKVLPAHFLHDPGFLERFEREVEVISSLEHPHILPIYEYGETDGVPFIAMRYLGGGSMAEMIREGTPELADLEKPFAQIAAALDYAHLHGVIHRDLKPGNIMLDEHGNAYLSDFGIARVMGSEMTGSAVIGTPAYMSPEQAHGLPIDARSDVYALGIVLFELITGRSPFQSETPMGLLLMHINEPLPDIREIRSEVPDEIVEVIEIATEKEVDKRFSSAGDMATAFRAALHGKRITPPGIRPKSMKEKTIITGDTRPAGHSKPVTDDASAPPIASPLPTSDDLPQATKSRSPLPALLGLLGLILLGGAAFLFSQGGLNPTPENPIIAVPTPFRSAQTITGEKDGYTISVPQRWEYSDRSNVSRTYHRWHSKNQQMFTAIAIPDTALASVDKYDLRYYANNETLTFIDEATAPDGTIRRSYRVENNDNLANGQLDVFYQTQDDALTIVEIYTADAVASNTTTLDTMQLILDSMRVNAG